MRNLARIGAIIVGLGIYSAVLLVHSRVDDERRINNDFTQDYASASALLADTDPYLPTTLLVGRFVDASVAYSVDDPLERNPHTPAHILFVVPLTALPFHLAHTLWIFLTLGLAGGVFLVVLRRLGHDPISAFLGSGLLLLTPVMQLELRWAQIDGLLLGLLAVTWLRTRRQDGIVGGIALGLAAALRLYPIILVVPLLRSGRRRAAISAMVTAVGVLGLSSAVIASSASLRSSITAASENFELFRGAPSNLSLVGLPFRWLTPSMWNPTAPDLTLLAWGIVIGIGGLGLAALLTTSAKRSGDLFWASLPWVLLMAPLTWTFSYTLLIPWLLFLLHRAGSSRLRLLVGVGATIAVASPGLIVQGSHGSALDHLIPTAAATGAVFALALSEWKRDSSVSGRPI